MKMKQNREHTMRNRQPQSLIRRGFSVTELLVVIVVSGILITSLFGMLKQDTEVQTCLDDQSSDLRRSRIAADLLFNDLIQAGARVVRVPMDASATAPARDYQPAYELLGPDFIVFNADLDPNFFARDTAITYPDFASVGGPVTLPGKSLQMSRADSQGSVAGVNGYAGAETVAYFLARNDLLGPDTYGANECTFTLYRQVNANTPEVVQRGVRSYDYQNDLPSYCNGVTAPTATDRLPIGPLFSYGGFFYDCNGTATEPCFNPQTWGDADLDGQLETGEIAGLAGPLNFVSGDRFNDNGVVMNSECDWILIVNAKGAQPAVYGCDTDPTKGKDVNGTGKIEMSLDEVVKTVNLQLTVESPQACDSYQQNNGFVRNQINLTIKPPNPPLRGVGCAPFPHNLSSLTLKKDISSCDGDCGRSIVLDFPVSVDDPFYTGATPVGTDDAEHDIVVYNIYQQLNGAGAFTQVAAMPPSDTGGSNYEFVLSGLDPSNSYTFKVKPSDCSGFESPEAPLPAGYTDLPPTATLPANPPAEPACAVVAANGMICSPDTVMLTWGYGDTVPSIGTSFVIEVEDASGNWIPATVVGASDMVFNPQNSVAGTEFRSGNCDVDSAAGPGYPDCYFAEVAIPDKVNAFQYRVLPPGHSGCYCGNCNPVTTCDWCSPNPPLCEVLDDPCSPDGVATLMVTWRSFELEACSGLPGVPELTGYRLLRDFSGANELDANVVLNDISLAEASLTDPPPLLDPGLSPYFMRLLAEDSNNSGECPMATGYPVGSICTRPAPGRIDPKGDMAAEGGGAPNYPRAFDPANPMTGCPTGYSGDPSDTEIQGAPIDQCALTDPVNSSRASHRYLQLDYQGLTACEPARYVMTSEIRLPSADQYGVQKKYFVADCLGTPIPNQDGYDVATGILSPDPYTTEVPYMGPVDQVGPTYLTYGPADYRLPTGADKMCYEVPSIDPNSPLINAPANDFQLGLQIAQSGSIEPGLTNVEMVRYTTALDEMPLLETANPDPGLPDSRVVDFSFDRGYEVDGSGWHDKADPYSWPTLNGLERSHKVFTGVAAGDSLRYIDPADSGGDTALNYHNAYHYRLFSTGIPYGCGDDDAPPRSCSYGFTNYIPARPEPVFSESMKYEFGFVDNGIKFNTDAATTFGPADLPAINLNVEGNNPLDNYIEVFGLSRSDCQYTSADDCQIPDPACEDVTYRWFRRECDASSADPIENCTAPVDASDPGCLSVVDELNRITINNNSLPLAGQYEVGVAWDQVIRGVDRLGNAYLQASDSVANAAGQMMIKVPDCDPDGEKVFYYTVVAERTVTLPDGTQRTLYSEPSPLIKLDCEEQESCGVSCEPNNGDPYGNNWGMVCMNEVGKPTSGDNIFRMQGASYEMVINLRNMAVTSYKHYNPDMSLPHPQTGLPISVTDGYYEYVDQRTGIPLILAYDGSEKGEDDLPLAGLVTDGGPFIGGDDAQWRVISHTKRGPFEQELVAVFGGNNARKVIWRFHPDTVMLHIEWGGSDPDFFTVVNTSPNRGNGGYFDAATSTRLPRTMMLSAPDDMLSALPWSLLAAPGDHNYRMDNWAGTPVKSRCDQVTGWETLPLSRRQLAVWSTAGLPDSGTDPYDASQASPSILSLEWQEFPSGANQSQNFASPNYDRDPAGQWLYAEADGFSRRNSTLGSAGLEPGCTRESSVTSVRIPEVGMAISNPNFLDLIFRPLYKTQMTGTNGAFAYSDEELYTFERQLGAVEVAVPFFANRGVILVSDPNLGDGSEVKYPNYLFKPDDATDIWKLGMDPGGATKTSAEPNPTFTGGSAYYSEGRPLIYIPEWGGYVFGLKDPDGSSTVSGETRFRIEYDTDRLWDDDGIAPFVPIGTGWKEEELGVFSGLPLPQPRFYVMKWDNDATNTAILGVDRDGGDTVTGSCNGLSMTMFRDGSTDTSYGAMGVMAVTFENDATRLPVGWPLSPDNLTTMSNSPTVLIRLKSGNRPDTAN